MHVPQLSAAPPAAPLVVAGSAQLTPAQRLRAAGYPVTIDDVEDARADEPEDPARGEGDHLDRLYGRGAA